MGFIFAMSIGLSGCAGMVKLKIGCLKYFKNQINQ